MSQSTPPGPTGRALLDSLRLLRQDPLDFLQHTTQDYGDVVSLRLKVLDLYILNHPDAVKYVLLDNHRNYTKDTFQYNLLASITGRGLLTSDGNFWLRQRRLAQPAFHRSRIAALSSLVTSATMRMLDRWERLPPGDREIDVDDEMMRLTLEIVGKALFSVDLSDEAGELTAATLTALDDLIYRSRNPFSLPRAIPTRRNRRFHQALETLDQAVYRLIAERRSEQPEPIENVIEEDLLSMLLHARDPETGTGMNDRQLRDEIITLLIAGHETVASALTWTWYLLSQNPAQVKRLDQELNTVLGGRTPEFKDLSNLPIVQNIFEETLRLYPPAWIISRKAIDSDRIDDFKINANSLIIISPYSLHRHPGFWEEPDAFDPDRFSPGRSESRPRFAFIPFGGGPRLCIGDSFARMEAQLILAAVSPRFRMEVIPGQPVEVEPLVTLRPRHGLRMKLVDQQHQSWSGNKAVRLPEING